MAQLSFPSTKCHKATDDQYIGMYGIASSYHVTAGLRKGLKKTIYPTDKINSVYKDKLQKCFCNQFE
jgi:hypothetical protein